MSKSEYTVGSDSPNTSTYSPRRGSGGTFAQYLQGHTPKYSINRGFRGDHYRNTLARMLVRVDRSELQQFMASISDRHVRQHLAERIAGDPTNSLRDNTATSNGYLDFLITQVTHSVQEKVQVQEVLSDNYVAFAFGQKAPVWQYSGYLLNTVQDDQASNFFRLYTEILRISQLARRQKTINLVYDSYIITGAMMDLNMQLSGNNEQAYTMSFNLLVKKVGIINYTANWVPNRASTPFAADVNAVAYDGRPRQQLVLREIVARAPEGTELLPARQQQTDSRVNTVPPENNVTTQPRNYSIAAEALTSNNRPETLTSQFSASPNVLRSRP